MATSNCFPIHIGHRQTVWAHWHAVHGHTVAALHSYTHLTWLRLGFRVTCGVKMMSIRHGWGWGPPQTASSSILDIDKLFEHIDMMSIVIQEQPYAVIPTLLGSDFGLVHPEMHDFYVKTNLRQRSGDDAITCASVSPMRLHCRICHTEINTQLIIAQRRGNGGQSLITFLAFGRSSLNFSWDTSFWGLFLEAREDTPKNWLRATARPQIQLWWKIKSNQK
jgi:hypothetical protein